MIERRDDPDEVMKEIETDLEGFEERVLTLKA